jgi:benzylsuccinate CoA-transferase BbsF subunit
VASGNFVCAGGEWIYLRALPQPQWEALVRVTRLPADLGGLDQAARRPRAAEIYAGLQAYCGSKERTSVLDELNAAGVSAVPLRSVKEAIAYGRVREAGLVQDVDDAYAGPLPVPVGLFASKQFGGVTPKPEPLLGQHTREVLEGLLGYAREQVDELLARGIVSETVPPSATVGGTVG